MLFILLCFSDVTSFSKLKARTSIRKRITTRSIVVVWKGTHNIPDACLQLDLRSGIPDLPNLLGSRTHSLTHPHYSPTLEVKFSAQTILMVQSILLRLAKEPSSEANVRGLYMLGKWFSQLAQPPADTPYGQH